MNTLLTSFARFLVALLFMMLGLVGLLIPLSPTIRTNFVTFILENSTTLFLFSLSAFLIGLAMIVYSIVGNKREHFSLRIDNVDAQVNFAVIQSYLENYWKELFPKSAVHHRLTIKKKAILINAELPYVPRSDQKQFLERIKKDLAEIFFSTMGYPHHLELSASFQSDPGRKP